MGIQTASRLSYARELSSEQPNTPVSFDGFKKECSHIEKNRIQVELDSSTLRKAKVKKLKSSENEDVLDGSKVYS